jgi:hypothetical protein
MLGACGSRKSTVTSSFLKNETETIQVAEQLTIDSSINQKEQIKETETKQLTIDETEQYIRIEFDTEKPVNTETNLPPVKSIEVKVKVQKTAENTEKTTDIETELNKNVQEWAERFLQSQSKTDTKGQIKEVTEKKESQKLKWIAIMGICGVLITLFLFSEDWKKVVNWIKNLLKKPQ